jgi:hypothetical protein
MELVLMIILLAGIGVRMLSVAVVLLVPIRSAISSIKLVANQ